MTKAIIAWQPEFITDMPKFYFRACSEIPLKPDLTSSQTASSGVRAQGTAGRCLFEHWRTPVPNPTTRHRKTCHPCAEGGSPGGTSGGCLFKAVETDIPSNILGLELATQAVHSLLCGRAGNGICFLLLTGIKGCWPCWTSSLRID